MSSERIADRRRMFEWFTKIKMCAEIDGDEGLAPTPSERDDVFASRCDSDSRTERLEQQRGGAARVPQVQQQGQRARGAWVSPDRRRHCSRAGSYRCGDAAAVCRAQARARAGGAGFAIEGRAG
eukprot:3565121-Rhodomonas_salina.1